jgi:benzil reductase ((S)-benzoin forming)
MTASGVVFISNAGVIGPIGRVGGVSFTELSEAITTNLVAPMILASQLASICRAHFKRLNVLHIGSGAAKHPIQGWSTYCTAKAGASMFFACLAAENPSWKIIDADPGVIDTGMQAIIRGASREMFPAVDDFIELKDRGDLQDPAQVAKDLLRKIGH